MQQIIEIAERYGDGLITEIQFRNYVVIALMKVNATAELEKLCRLLTAEDNG